jgi:uncharacterized Rmd1/YagE family protein
MPVSSRPLAGGNVPPTAAAIVLRAVARSHADRLRLKTRAGSRPVSSTSPMVLDGRSGGRLVAFRFGASVAVGLDDAEEQRLVAEVEKLVESRHEPPGREEAELRVGGEDAEGVGLSGQILLRSLEPERLEVVANVLAKSAVLDYYEARVGGVFETIEPLARRLRDGDVPRSGHQILQQLGDALLVQTATVGRIEVTEKPEVTWESSDLDRLYERLAKEFELAERDRALARKLELVATVANTYLDLLNNRRALRVEWYIVLLIVLEIALSLYALFLA